MRNFSTKINHMRLQTAYSDHVGAQVTRFVFDCSSDLGWIDYDARNIHGSVTIGRQLDPSAAIRLNRRLHGSVVGRFVQPHRMNHLGQYRIGHPLLSSRSYSAHRFTTEVKRSESSEYL